MLPLWYKPPNSTDPSDDASAPDAAADAVTAGARPRPKRGWLLSQELLEAQPQLQAFFCSVADQQMTPDAEVGEGNGGRQQQGNLAGLPQDLQSVQANLVEQQATTRWLPAPAHITTEEQYTTQACGWPASWQVIQAALNGQQQQQQQHVLQAPLHPQTQQGRQQRQNQQCDSEEEEELVQQRHEQSCEQAAALQHTPVQQLDGILGFSQGAAVAAVVAALCQQQQEQQQENLEGRQACLKLKFVLLASGFVSPDPEHKVLLQQQAPLRVPSLHMFAAAAGGGSGADRQIQQQMSEQLLGLFDEGVVITHSAGHMVPSDAQSVAEIKAFLQLFV